MGTFPDVTEENVFYDDIEWAAERDIYNGHTDGTFRPKDPVLREQDAKTLRRTVKLLDPELAERLETGPPPDVTPPMLTLLGPNPMMVLQGNAYVEPGWEVSDDMDDDVTVTVAGSVDTGVPKTYQLEYTATDDAGNFDFDVRIVVVEAFVPPPGQDFDVILNPGDNLQAKVDQAGEASVVGVAPGLFVDAGVTARPGQRFELVDPEEETVWDGAGRSYGLRGPAVQGVVIRGHGMWKLRNYNTGKYRGVIDTFSAGDWYNNPEITASGWDVDGVRISASDYGVTLFGHNARLTNFELYDIGTLGFSMRFHDDMYVGQGRMWNIGKRNLHGSWGHEGGGSKSWETVRLVHEDIEVFDVQGPGLWTDHGNLDTVYRRIYAYMTSAAALFHEISGWCSVEDCLIENQPPSGGDSIWSRGGAGVTIANAKARISGSTLTNMETGIAFLDQSRSGWSNTTEGSVVDTVLNGAGRSGSGNDHGGPKPPVEWADSVVLKGGSTID